MSTSGAVSGSQNFQLNDQRLFPETFTADGTIEKTLADGTVIRATIVGSQIVAYQAFDSSGNSIPVRRMRLKNAAPGSLKDATSCWYCICNPDCRCWPETCPA